MLYVYDVWPMLLRGSAVCEQTMVRTKTNSFLGHLRTTVFVLVLFPFSPHERVCICCCRRVERTSVIVAWRRSSRRATFFSYSDVLRTTRHNVFGHHHLCYRYIGCYHYLWLIRGRLIRRQLNLHFFLFFFVCLLLSFDLLLFRTS